MINIYTMLNLLSISLIISLLFIIGVASLSVTAQRKDPELIDLYIMILIPGLNIVFILMGIAQLLQDLYKQFFKK